MCISARVPLFHSPPLARSPLSCDGVDRGDAQRARHGVRHAEDAAHGDRHGAHPAQAGYAFVSAHLAHRPGQVVSQATPIP